MRKKQSWPLHLFGPSSHLRNQSALLPPKCSSHLLVLMAKYLLRKKPFGLFSQRVKMLIGRHVYTSFLLWTEDPVYLLPGSRNQVIMNEAHSGSFICDQCGFRRHSMNSFLYFSWRPLDLCKPEVEGVLSDKTTADSQGLFASPWVSLIHKEAWCWANGKSFWFFLLFFSLSSLSSLFFSLSLSPMFSFKRENMKLGGEGDGKDLEGVGGGNRLWLKYMRFLKIKKANLKRKLFVSVKDISYLNEGCFFFSCLVSRKKLAVFPSPALSSAGNCIPGKVLVPSYLTRLPCQISLFHIQMLYYLLPFVLSAHFFFSSFSISKF